MTQSQDHQDCRKWALFRYMDYILFFITELKIRISCYLTIFRINVIQFNKYFYFILHRKPGVQSVPRNKNIQRSYLHTRCASILFVQRDLQSDWFLLPTCFFIKNCQYKAKKNFGFWGWSPKICAVSNGLTR